MEIFVINLARRPDRLSTINARLDDLGLTSTTVVALDGRDLGDLPAGTLVSPSSYACWASHLLAHRAFLSSGESHALILEDDAVLDATLDWITLLYDMPAEMKRHSLDYLQLGYISTLYRSDSLRNLVRRALSADVSKFDLVMANRRFRALDGVSRAGSHGYVLTREMANLLQHHHQPAWVNPDGFLERLASSRRDAHTLRMACLQRSVISQESRVGHRSLIDSDIQTLTEMTHD